MIISIALAAALVCQSAAPAPSVGAPLPPPQTGSLAAALQAPRPSAPATKSVDAMFNEVAPQDVAPAPPPPPAPQKTVAELFRERAAREAAAKATQASSPPPADGEYRCRRTATSVACGTDEETIRRLEAETKARLDEMLSPK